MGTDIGSRKRRREMDDLFNDISAMIFGVDDLKSRTEIALDFEEFAWNIRQKCALMKLELNLNEGLPKSCDLILSGPRKFLGHRGPSQSMISPQEDLDSLVVQDDSVVDAYQLAIPPSQPIMSSLLGLTTCVNSAEPSEELGVSTPPTFTPTGFPIDSVEKRNLAIANFKADLRQIEGQIRKNNVVSTVAFKNKDLADISSFFFDELVDVKSYEYLIDVISQYSSRSTTGPLPAIQPHPALVTTLLDSPTCLQNFASVFFTLQSYKKDVKASALDSLLQVCLHLILLRTFNELRDKAGSDNKELMSFLDQQGLQLSRGVRKHSLVMSFLSKILGVPIKNLHTFCQSAIGIQDLVQYYGSGIILLIPHSSIYRLNRWGNQKMKLVYPLLQQHAPWLLGFCNQLERQVYQAIISGKRLPFVATSKDNIKLAINQIKI